MVSVGRNHGCGGDEMARFGAAMGERRGTKNGISQIKRKMGVRGEERRERAKGRK